MLNHERRAFWKFFSVYFGSVALLILVAGFFYFGEQEKLMIKKEHFSMIEFTRQYKMKMNPQNEHISYEEIEGDIENFNMNNFTIEENRFLKYMPYSWEGGYILITKDKVHYHEKLFMIKLKIMAIQVLLLALFGVISYLLAVRALRPMQDAIVKLDNFSKDLIHDLNTPITSMFLNIKLLEAKENKEENKPLQRIKQSLTDIGELQSNLTILLQEESMIVCKENVFEIVSEVVNTHRKIYPNLQFIVIEKELHVKINRDAFKQVMQNLISNASKYNVKNGYVKVFMKDNYLNVEDGGVGIENPKQIFERSYTEHKSGYGIGLDIVKRLCERMDIEISADSKLGEGTTISLAFTA